MLQNAPYHVDPSPGPLYMTVGFSGPMPPPPMYNLDLPQCKGGVDIDVR